MAGKIEMSTFGAAYYRSYGRQPDFGVVVILCFVILSIASAVAQLIISVGRNLDFFARLFVVSVAVTYVLLHELPTQGTPIGEWLWDVCYFLESLKWRQ